MKRTRKRRRDYPLSPFEQRLRHAIWDGFFEGFFAIGQGIAAIGSMGLPDDADYPLPDILVINGKPYWEATPEEVILADWEAVGRDMQTVLNDLGDAFAAFQRIHPLPKKEGE